MDVRKDNEYIRQEDCACVLTEDEKGMIQVQDGCCMHTDYALLYVSNLLKKQFKDLNS